MSKENRIGKEKLDQHHDLFNSNEVVEKNDTLPSWSKPKLRFLSIAKNTQGSFGDPSDGGGASS